MAQQSEQYCMLTNDDSTPTSVPYQPDKDHNKPFTADPSIAQACPDFVGKPVCCNTAVINSMISKYSLMNQA